jgi:hypothetical protein
VLQGCRRYREAESYDLGVVDPWSSSDGEALTADPDGQALADGWTQHRRRVRRGGPVVALVVPLMLAAVATAAMWGSTSWWRGALGLVAAMAAAPLLPVVGVPAAGGLARLVLGGVGSAALWMLLGAVAARRATRTPGASWPEWRREYGRLAVGAMVGGVGALAVAAGVTLLRLR